MRAAEQGPKQESIQDWNIHLYLGLLCEFNMRKKRRLALKKCYSFAAVRLGKDSGALRWLICQNLRLSRKYVTWKAIFLGSEGMIGKGASGKWRVFPGATSWRVLRQSKVGSVNSAATWKPYSAGQIPRISAILRGCLYGHWSRIWTTNL